MENKEKIEKIKLKRILIISFFIIAIFGIVNNFNKTILALKYFLNIIKPFIYGLILGYIILFPVRKLQKIITRGKETKYNNLAKIISLIFVYCIIFAMIYFFLSWILPFLYNAAIDILEHMPQYLDSLEKYLHSIEDNRIISRINIDDMFKNIRSLDISKIMLDYLKNFNVQNGINAVFSAAGVLIKTIIVIVISFNIILYSESLDKEIKFLASGLLGNEKANKIRKVLKKIDEVFVKFIYGQFIDSIVVGIIFVIAFLILKIKHAVALGILIGIGNFIPYVGTFLSILTTTLVTIFTGGLPQGILILCVSTVLQQIDAQIINPAIIGNKLDLNPPLIILAILIGGAYFGPVIVFLAAPILAVLRSVIVDHIQNKKIKKKIQKIERIRKPIKYDKQKYNKYKQVYKLDYSLNYIYQKKKNRKTLKRPKAISKGNLNNENKNKKAR